KPFGQHLLNHLSCITIIIFGLAPSKTHIFSAYLQFTSLIGVNSIGFINNTTECDMQNKNNVQ
ncbi:hypothetical protein ACJX0J_039895, partial [Zea mays]